MVDLSELLVSIHPTGTPPVKEFYVFNSNHWSCNNGGCCYQWTVPAKTTFIKFEIILINIHKTVFMNFNLSLFM